ncbi:MAG: PadR family transcriptional regulator [Acidobacteria bacterium]|nr:PadR family transcriptional regulator [Acidobacteriota bacterium]
MSISHVLLGLLLRGPAAGWDLKARIEKDSALAWDAELSQIYPAMRKLLRGGFVAMKRRSSTKGPSRCEYRLTPRGRKEFFDWLAEPPEIPRERDATLVRLAFLERASPEKRLEWLRSYRTLLASSLKQSPPATNAARRRRRALLATEIAWVESEINHVLSQISNESEAVGGP